MLLAIILLGVGVVLVYSAVKGKDPREVVTQALRRNAEGN